jgi:uncharacterized membrane protein
MEQSYRNDQAHFGATENERTMPQTELTPPIHRMPRVERSQDGAQAAQAINVGKTERTLSTLSGLAIIALAMRTRGWKGVALALVGANMLVRGSTGYCWIYKALGINTAVGSEGRQIAIPHEQGVRVERSIIIRRPLSEVYRFWRNLENLPRFMEMLDSVRVLNDGVSRWTVTGPAGVKLTWDAVVINEQQNKLLAWRSKEGAQVANSGTVTFRPTADGQGTILNLKMEYIPPAGQVGNAVAKLLGFDPAVQVPEDLTRLKQILESSVVPLP